MITGLVEMPKVPELEGFAIFEKNFPTDARILKELIQEYNQISSEKIKVIE